MALSPISGNSASCLELNALQPGARLRNWLRRAAMSEWARVAVTVICSVLGSALSAGLLVWNLLNDHESRLRLLDLRMITVEKGIEVHMKAHAEHIALISGQLTDIKVEIGRIQGARNGGR